MSGPVMSNPTDAVTDPVAAPFQLKLIVASGPDFAKELVLAQGKYRIGKDPTADLVLGDPQVSRFHVDVEVLPTGPRFTDLGSTNGSFCEGERFNTVDGKPGANLRFGNTELKLVPVRPKGAATSGTDTVVG